MRWTSPSLVLALALGAGTVRAEGPLSLHWTAPAECPPESAVRARLDQLVGAAAAETLVTPLTVDATVAASGQQYTLVLRTTQGDVHGERRLVGATCAEVTSAGALVIALAIDPSAGTALGATTPVAAFETSPDLTEATAPARQQPAPNPEPPAARPARPSPAPSGATKRAPPRLGARLLGSVDSAALPGVATGVGGGVLMRGGGFRAALEGTYFPGRRGEPEEYPRKGADFSMATGTAVGCWMPLDRRGALGGCAVVEAGALGARAVGIASGRDESKAWVALGAALAGDIWMTEWLALAARVGVLVPLGRPTYAFVASDGTNAEVHRPDLIGIRSVFAIDVVLP